MAFPLFLSLIVIVKGNGLGDPSSNPGRYYPSERYASHKSPSSYELLVVKTWLFDPRMATGLEEVKI